MSNFNHSTIPPVSEQLTREELARQLLPLLQQFEATYDPAEIIHTPLFEAFRRLSFNAQYHADGGA